MSHNPYELCPCGSGKKFKWCCQELYSHIERAFDLFFSEQQDAALKLLDELAETHPNNAEVWGRKAEILLELGQVEAAEAALDKALAVNPNYAFAYFLRGILRHQEGELIGALHLYRQAARLLSPLTRHLFAEVYNGILRCELALGHPIAARAALDIAQRYAPSDPTLQEAEQRFFQPPATMLPELARTPRNYLPLSEGGDAGRVQVWQQARQAASEGRLTEALALFQRLAAEDEQDAAAWYNLGLCLAQLGENVSAVEALDRYVALTESDEDAAEAWALAEVLRFGAGTEEISDWVAHYAFYAFSDLKSAWDRIQTEGQMPVLEARQNAVAGLILDRIPQPIQEHTASFELPQILGRFLWYLEANYFVVTALSLERFAQACQFLESVLGPLAQQVRETQRAASFSEVSQELFAVVAAPSGSAEKAEQLAIEVIRSRLEGDWINRPLRSLGSVSPLDAAEHPVLRRKLLGVIRFLEDLMSWSKPGAYDFGRLRHKLRLKPLEAVAQGPGKPDFDAMNVAELTALDPAQLSDSELESAFQASRRLNAQELAAHFARVLVSRPANPERLDRYALFGHMIHVALDQGDYAGARELIEAGLKYDCEHNEGRRRNDYDLRLAQLHLRSGQIKEAVAAYERLTQRLPQDMDLLGRAAEAMLSARQPSQAAAFAERGLGVARSQGDRDRMAYFEELLAAARK
jgi:tetratricopeptide (TPR) repeat protein